MKLWYEYEPMVSISEDIYIGNASLSMQVVIYIDNITNQNTTFLKLWAHSSNIS